MLGTNLLEQIQYSKDNPKEYEIELDLKGKKQNINNFDAFILTSAIQIKKDLFPKIDNSINQVLENLNLDENFRFFITPDNAVANAYCTVLPKSDRADIVFTSRLIELFDEDEIKFVIGHEIGHYIYQHYLYPNSEKYSSNDIKYFNALNLRKSAEISCDRVGLLAIGDLERALKVMVKASSGLSSKHIQFNFNVFIEQLESLKKLQSNKFLMNSSHPSIFTRAQALMWFNDSNTYSSIKKSKKIDKQGLELIDNRIEEQINLLVSKERDSVYNENINKCLFWSLIYLILEDNRFSPEEQIYLEEMFSKTKVQSLKNYLRSSNATNLIKKLNEVLEESKSLPVSSKKDILRKLDQFIKEFNKTESMEIIKRIGRIKGILKIR